MRTEKNEIKRPNFFIAGAARSGTTSLSHYLVQHPEVYMPREKEVHYYAADYFPCNGPGDERLNKIVIHDEDHYAQLFEGVMEEKAVGESSVFYLCLPGTAERIVQAVPGAKIIILLRNPVDRAYSAYLHLVRDGREPMGFAEGLQLEEERCKKGFEPLWWYKDLGLYYEQVKRYLHVFGIENVKVVVYDEFNANPEQVLHDIFVFLGVREDIAIDTSVHYNVAGIPKSRRIYSLLESFTNNHSVIGKGIKSLIPMRLGEAWLNKAMSMSLRSTPMDAQIHTQLTEYFAEDIEKLEDLLCRNLSCWGHRRQSIAYER
jgi:Sulfotransferase family